MNKVRRCAQGAERGAQAWSARLTPLDVGDRDTPFHLWGLRSIGAAEFGVAPGTRDAQRRCLAWEIFFFFLPGNILSGACSVRVPGCEPAADHTFRSALTLNSESHIINVTLSSRSQWWGILLILRPHSDRG